MIAEWEDAFVVSDAHPLVEGHLLVVAKRHMLSFGELQRDELVRLRANITNMSALLSLIRSPVIVFERGNKVQNVSGNQSIDHAHLHLIPCVDIKKYLPESKMNADFLDLSSYITSGSYYFYWNVQEGVAYRGSAEQIQSQFIRKSVAEANSLELWNWRSNPSSEQTPVEHCTRIRDLMSRRLD